LERCNQFHKCGYLGDPKKYLPRRFDCEVCNRIHNLPPDLDDQKIVGPLSNEFNEVPLVTLKQAVRATSSAGTFGWKLPWVHHEAALDHVAQIHHLETDTVCIFVGREAD